LLLPNPTCCISRGIGLTLPRTTNAPRASWPTTPNDTFSIVPATSMSPRAPARASWSRALPLPRRSNSATLSVHA
jgi:hypothetical protein